MKKVLAVLLAVVMAFSVVAICASAEEGTGSTYTFSEMPRISLATPEGEVAILKAGDTISFGTLTAASKNIKIYYYPDAASIASRDWKNVDWKDNKVEKYSLDTSKWVLDTEKGETVADFTAKSPNYYKSFATSFDFAKGDALTVTVSGMGDVATARDSVPNDRGEAPIDFALKGGKFLGWVMLKSSGNVTATSKNAGSIELYALWDRDVETSEGDGPTFEETDDPIVNAMNKVLYYIGIASGWVRTVPALLSAGIAMILNTGVKNWLYGIFGIETKA